ncbi:MAG: hypothetical protein PVG11_08050, partial [Anaerolineae bacterium]
MQDAINPYIPGQPVENPDLFFGRREIQISIREHLVKGRRIFVVAGEARIGKTSLLRRLSHDLPEGFCPIRLELLLDEDVSSLDRLLWRVADAVARQVAARMDVEVAAPAWSEFEGQTDALLDRFWPEVRQVLDGTCLLLLVDDLEEMAAAGDGLLDGFLSVLGEWRAREPEIGVVVACELEGQDPVSQHAQFFGGAMSYTLGPLQSEAAMRLITWPVDGAITYDYGVARRIIEITSGHPYYLQLICFEVFNRCAAAGWVNQRDVDVVVAELVQREIEDFRLLWEASSSPERAVLAALVSLRGARGIATVQEVRTVLNKAGARVEREHVTQALEGLARRGVLEPLGALSYRFRVALLREWLALRLDLDDVVRHTRWGADSSQHAVAQQGVTKLSAKRRREAPATVAGAEAAAPAARPFRWFGLAALAVVIIVVLLLVVPPLLGGQPVTPTATESAALPSATPLLPTGSATEPQPASGGTAAPPAGTAVPLPSETPLPGPTLTPSPTPPLVVARSVPSIAYQARPADASTWFVSVMNSDGSARLQLTKGQTAFLSAPSWSPAGDRIAFVSNQDGHDDIWVMDRDGENLVNLTDDEPKDHSPAWSPDGEWIAFGSVRDVAYWEIYLMRPDGSDVRRLTWWEDASDLYPSWSPDGTRLAFSSKRDGNWEIYIMK